MKWIILAVIVDIMQGSEFQLTGNLHSVSLTPCFRSAPSNWSEMKWEKKEKKWNETEWTRRKKMIRNAMCLGQKDQQ